MKMKLAAMAATVCLSACTNTGTNTGAASQQSTPVSTASADAWYPGETVSTEVLIGTPTVIRRGHTPSGNSYAIYADGSASVKSLTDWSIGCGKDKMSDKRECTLTNGDASLFIDYRASSSPQSICVLSHDFPGRVGAIRAGANAAVDTNGDGCVEGNFIKQLLGASEVTTRAVKWPYDSNRDVTKPTAGLKDAMDLIAYIQRTIVK